MDEKMKEALKSIFEKLTEEQKEKANACKNADELMKLFGEWDIELPDELVGQVAGGYSEVVEGDAIRSIKQFFGID